MIRIAVGSDHAGFDLKNALIEHLKNDYELTDVGTYDKSSCNYPTFAEKVARAVADGECEFGILCCGTGIGVAMAANKVAGIRAATVGDCFSAKATRAHNNANVLCMGERVTGPGLACLIADIFLTTPFEGGRHQKRVDMISEIENKK